MTTRRTKRTTSRGWERKRANRDTRQEIIDAAAKAFASQGYEGTSLSQIARAVGIKTPALYYHYKSKNAILFAALKASGEKIIAGLDVDPAAAGSSPAERLRDYVTGYITTSIELQNQVPLANAIIFTSQIGKALTRPQQAWVVEFQRDVIGRLRQILSDGREKGDFSFAELAPTAFSIMGSIDFVVNWYRPGGRLTPATIADLYADFALKTAGYIKA